ncbi:MAG: response regulator transcription factor [Rubrobacter sp.]|nr:response regulator transcription factor [Rubrobacter sp.]
MDGKDSVEGTRSIRVLLADDHAMVRESMAEMLALAGDIEVVGQAADGREAVTLARETKPDAVILDVEMPVMGVQAALRRLLSLSPPPKVLVVTVFGEQHLVRELLGLGASAYLSKNAHMQDLISAVRSVVHDLQEGNVVLSVPQSALGAEGTENPLSRRETEVLLCAARGLSNGRTAAKLHLSETTVKRHLSNVYAKLEVGSRGEATSKALMEGWISSWDVSRGD